MRLKTLMTMLVAGALAAAAANPDLNGDGKVNRSDYRLLAAALVSGTYNAAYDLNGDGLLDAVDANLLLDQIPVATGSETFTVNGVSFTMVEVKGGTFTMGATAKQGSDAEDDEKPNHQVTLGDYWIGETEVTQELWQAVMGSNPSYFNEYGNTSSGSDHDFNCGINLQRPVEYVSWFDCQSFISKMNELTGVTFRLPAEAEWEIAACGGNEGTYLKYSGADYIDAVAWYYYNIPSMSYGSAGCGTQTVATKKANELGLYDMSGNVWEWCQDWYDSSYYSSSPTENPTGPSTGTSRVIRGGSWINPARYCRVSCRAHCAPSNTDRYLGLRLAR